MTTKKALLIQWIHTLDNGKRLDGFITEAYFEKTLACTQLELNSPAFGWFTADLLGDKEYRYWLKVVPPDYEPNTVETTLIERYSRVKGNKFFFLHPTLTATSFEREMVPLTFEISQWAYSMERKKADVRRGDVAFTKSRERLEKAISQMDKRLIEHLKKQEEVKAKSKSTPTRIDDWLNKSFTEEELLKLLATRCAINLISRFAIDRDAIDMDGDILRFIEFKRKYPTDKGWWQLKSAPSFFRHKDAAYRLDALYREAYAKATTVNDQETVSLKWEAHIRAQLDEKDKWEHVKGDCFGLDLSHVNTVVEAEKEEFGYVHIIWNEKETDLVNLLDFDLKPKLNANQKEVPLDIFHLTRASFNGVTITPGSKASSFYSRPRMQLTFPAE